MVLSLGLDLLNGNFKILVSELQAAQCEHNNQYTKNTTYTIYRLPLEVFGRNFGH